MRYRAPGTRKVLTVVGMGIMLLIGLIVGGGDDSGNGAATESGTTSQPLGINGSEQGSGGGKAPDGGSSGGSQPGRERLPGLRVRVSRVVDGDTIEVRMPNGTYEDIRYIGVDTPETVDPNEPVGCFGPQASHFNEGLVEGKTVRLRFDQERRDYYGRLLAYVYLGKTFVNAELLKRGLARAVYYSPNGAHRYEFEAISRRAGRAGRGLWGACR